MGTDILSSGFLGLAPVAIKGVGTEAAPAFLVHHDFADTRARERMASANLFERLAGLNRRKDFAISLGCYPSTHAAILSGCAPQTEQ